MPGRFRFQKVDEDVQRLGDAGVFTWQLAVIGDEAPEPQWRGLWELDYPEGASNPVYAYGVHNGSSEYFNLLRALCWTATSGGRRYVCPSFHRDKTAQHLGVRREEVILVPWEYSLGLDQALREADKGFAPARASTPITPEPDPWERANSRKAGLFEIDRFSQLAQVDAAIGGDATSLLTLYGTGERPTQPLVDALSADEPPTVRSVMATVDTFAAMAQDRDWYEPLESRVLLRAHRDLSTLLDALTEIAEVSWVEYCRSVPAIIDWSDFDRAMRALTHPVLNAIPGPG